MYKILKSIQLTIRFKLIGNIDVPLKMIGDFYDLFDTFVGWV